MKSIITLASLICLPIYLTGQSWSVGTQVSPFFYWYINESDNLYLNYNSHPKVIDYPSSFQPNGFGAGIPLRYVSDQNWFFQTGVFWNTQSLTYRSIEIVDSPFGRSPREHFKSRLDYVSIPLTVGLQYYLNYTQNFLFISAGVSTSYLVYFHDVRSLHSLESSNIVINNNSSHVVSFYSADGELTRRFDPLKIDPYKRWMFGGLIEAGINWNISKKIDVAFAFQGNMDFTNVDSNKHPDPRSNRGRFSRLPDDVPRRAKSWQYRLGATATLYYTIW